MIDDVGFWPCLQARGVRAEGLDCPRLEARRWRLISEEEQLAARLGRVAECPLPDRCAVFACSQLLDPFSTLTNISRCGALFGVYVSCGWAIMKMPLQCSTALSDRSGDGGDADLGFPSQHGAYAATAAALTAAVAAGVWERDLRTLRLGVPPAQRVPRVMPQVRSRQATTCGMPGTCRENLIQLLRNYLCSSASNALCRRPAFLRATLRCPLVKIRQQLAGQIRSRNDAQLRATDECRPGVLFATRRTERMFSVACSCMADALWGGDFVKVVNSRCAVGAVVAVGGRWR